MVSDLKFIIKEDNGKTTGLIKIDAELVRNLRLSGRREEANELVKAFREGCKENRKRLNSKLMARDREIKKFKGICVIPGCTNPIKEGSLSRCEKHLYEARVNTGKYLKAKRVNHV